MAQIRRKNKKTTVKQKIVTGLAIILLIFSGVITGSEYLHISAIPTWAQIFELAGLQKKAVENDSGLAVTFLDVGQGDCILLAAGETYALIDGGEAENAAQIISYLKNSGINGLDYIFATHPHSDHIGSLAEVMRAVPANQVIMPELPQSLVPATNVYNGFLSAVADTGAEGVYGNVGDVFPIGDGKLRILGPINSAKDLNNASLIIRLDYGNSSFLFTGDAETAEEKDLLASTSDLDVDVLKAGHHGSGTSSSDAFLSAATPDYAVISCGLNNQYGHPESILLQRLFNHGITCYRTDQSGIITCTTDGENIHFKMEKEAA